MKEGMKDRSLTTPEEMVELGVLLDVYGSLLKENQKEIMGAYVHDNLSLSEIAEEYGMSRQGVYDSINRTRKKLREFDSEIHLMEKLEQMAKSLDRIKEASTNIDIGGFLENGEDTSQFSRIISDELSNIAKIWDIDNEVGESDI